jgi:hypothetical protein
MFRGLLFFISVFCLNTINAQSNSEDFQLTHGTAIVCFFKPDTVWIVADTKAYVNDDSSFKSRKILKTNNIFYCFTGLRDASIKNVEIYDAVKIMEHVIKTKKDFKKAGVAFNDSIIKRLNSFLSILIENNKIDMIEKFSTAPVLEFMMVSFIDGKLVYDIRTFMFSKQAPKRVLIGPPPNKDAGNVFLMGKFLNIYSYLSINGNYWGDFSKIKERLICLIKIEAEDRYNSKYVGFPVDVLMVYKNGHKWFYDNKDCAKYE